MNTPMKVALVSHSDLLGGASIVTYRLLQALRDEGVDARMVVYTPMSDNREGIIYTLMPRWKRIFKFLGERIPIFLNNGMQRNDLFKVSTAGTGMPLWRNEWVREADVINLGWINQGVVSLRGLHKLGRLGKPIVWTMHDMWCMTGICHHAYECRNFERECGRCPLLRSQSPADLSHRCWKRKQRLYEQVPMSFVAVSSWLRDRARSSSLLADRPIEVIPNAFPVDSFPTEPYPNFPSFDPDTKRRRLIMGAARLDDDVKDFDMSIDALNWIFDNHPEVADNTGVIFFGDLRDRHKLDNLRFPHLFMGRVNDPRLLRQLYASSVAVLSTSHYETLPGTLIEGQAAGCLPVTFGNGGQRDIVSHLHDGYIVEQRTPEAFAEGVLWALRQTPDRAALHQSVARRFAADAIARRYIDLYSRLLAGGGMK